MPPSNAPESNRPVYSIGAVSKMLGLPAQTLRTWQERYGVIVPERSTGGHRLYSRGQIEQLRFVVDQVAAGRTAAEAHRLLQERLAAGLQLPSPSDKAHGSQLLILLAERDPYAAEFAEYFLRTEGYDVDLVLNDVERAFAQAVQQSPDLAIIDLLISGGQGPQLITNLRKRADIPILAISTFGQRDSALEAGAYAFVQKPIDPLQLVSTVQDLLGRSALVRRKQTS